MSHAALLQAILEDPDDVTARRVYADALSTAGDPRGELIQVQCELADDPRRDLLIRERELLAKHAKTWTAPFAKLVFHPTFERGMIAHAFVNTKKFVPAAAELLGREPVVSLALRGLTQAAAATLGAHPELARLHTLRVAESTLAERGTSALFTERLIKLRALDLYQAGVNDAGLQHLRATVLTRLERLVLSGNRLTAQAVDGVLGDPRLTRLTALALAWLAPGPLGARRIAQRLELPSLTHLDLACLQYTDAELAVLATNRTFAGLRGLRLEQNRLTGAGAIDALAPLEALEELDLSTTAFGVGGATALAAARFPLRRLDLMQGGLGDDGISALATARCPLETLDLRYCGIGPRGAEALAGAAWSLVELDLWANPLGNAAAHAFANAGFARTIKTLGLGHGELTDDGIVALANGAWPALEHLTLYGNAIGEVGARALAASTTMPALRSINLGATGVPKAPLAPLRKRGIELAL